MPPQPHAEQAVKEHKAQRDREKTGKAKAEMCTEHAKAAPNEQKREKDIAGGTHRSGQQQISVFADGAEDRLQKIRKHQKKGAKERGGI